MISSQHVLALKTIHNRLQKIESVWAITGSCGFVLQGMELEVNDIDLQTDASGAYEVESVFPDMIISNVRFSKSDKFASHCGELTIDGVKVEIMGALQKKLPDGTWESPVDIKTHREFITFEGMVLPVLSLAYEEQAYRILGREERANQIKEWVSRR
ncbi:MAG: hypothetical protein OXN17_19855 [Candidatus Poribacteria bacterium]|nr:hypothetical protein [Candidatus Poribacteria bacterium]MDE0503953.1 hypothetical protein [Candidatus Poribacteria bacterium]